MRVPLRAATGLAGAGFVLVLALAAWAVARSVATRVMQAEAKRHLTAATTLGAERLRAAQEESADSVAAALARSSGYRVSVFDEDQRLIADSDFGPPRTDAPPEPAERSEVAGALRRVTASSRRVSAMDDRPYVFSAARLYRSGRPVVIRFAAPVTPIEAAAGRIARGVGLAVLLAGAAGVYVLYRATGALSGKLDSVRQLLTRIAAGQTAGPRVKLSRFIEVARVASAANRVRGELDEQLGGVTRERDELAQLMDEVGEGLMALTDDARILRINPAARGLLGLVEVLPFSPVGSLVRDPLLRDFLEASVVRAEGRLEVTVGDRELEVRTKRGTAGGAVVLLVDITEIRRLEAVRTDFVANASHELKTPLTVIRAAAETVLDAELPADLRSRFLRSIEGNTVRLQRLVDDLLDLSRYESGAWRPEREPLLVHEVAAAVWEELEERRAGPELEFRIAGEGEVMGDEAAVYQIFRNLFENAMRYVPGEGGRIKVGISQAEDVIEVAVEDNGSGIPPSSLPRIFERFYRVDTARSREEGGTGLGLAIVRHLVSSMGGEARARSSLGAGTTITFTIPAAESFKRAARREFALP
ncbi:MAG: ATP-binding protein [Gemmatimonadota bacterium]|nr:ATP-binding protein [Gemmatimonadota bacterium]